MSKEFKRIFKVLDEDKLTVSKSYIPVEQYYLNFSPRIRYRKQSEICTMTVKINITESEKVEHACRVDDSEYENLKSVRVTKLMEKHRHSASFGDNIGIYDKYFGDFEGLKILSMEFSSMEEMDNFKVPDFLEETGDVITVEELKF